MARGRATVRVAVDTRETYADMRALANGLDDAITQTLQVAGELVIKAAIPLTPYKADDDHPHLRDSYYATARGLVASVGSNLPQGPVWEWGGDISPGAHRGARSAARGAGKGLVAKRANAGARSGSRGGTFTVTDPAKYIIHIPRTSMIARGYEQAEAQIEADLSAAIDRLKARFDLG